MRESKIFVINAAMAILLTSFIFLTLPTAKAPPPATTQWNIQTISSDGDVGEHSSIVLDSSDDVHIIFYDNTEHDLKYIYSTGDEWKSSTVDYGYVGQDASIALDSADKVHISYRDIRNGDLKYATNVEGSWSIATVDSAGIVGLDTSIAIDSADKAHISYYDFTNADLKYATNAGGSWSNTTIDGDGVVGMDSSIAIDSEDKVHISYRDSTNSNLKHATNAGGQWTNTTVDDDGYVGWFTSIALDSMDEVHISYYDYVDYDLKYATSTGGQWSTTIIDSIGNVGEYSSLAIDSSNQVHISYYDFTNADMKYATDAGGSWSNITLDSDGYVGSYTSLALDSSDRVHISYHDLTNHDLKHAAEVSGPSAPLNLQAVPGDSSVDLSWSTPSYKGPGALYYHLFRDGAEVWSGTALSYHDAPLSNGVQYMYNVAVQNSVGWSQNSSSVSASPQLTATVPLAPQNLAATSGDSQITLTWSAPISDGGSPITNYKVYDVSSSEAVLVAKLGDILNYTITSLTNGQTYHHRVSAVNSVGEGPSSSEAHATPMSVPSAPQNFTAKPGVGSISLNWNTPVNNGGSAIIGYKIFRQVGTDNATLLNITAANITAYSDTTVMTETAYSYFVKAVNSAGEGANSTHARATLLMVPSAPRNLTVMACAGKVTLNWTVPAYNGGSNITGYEVYRNDSTSALATLGASARFYVDSNGTAGETYTYWVKAVNAVGDGNSSDRVSAAAQKREAVNNTLLYAGAGVVGVATIGAAAYFLLRRKK